jgi:hypothetical protein
LFLWAINVNCIQVITLGYFLKLAINYQYHQICGVLVSIDGVMVSIDGVMVSVLLLLLVSSVLDSSHQTIDCCFSDLAL